MAKVLVIGSGGREHALAWSLSRSPQVDHVFVAPGNGGTQWESHASDGLQAGAPCISVDIQVDDTTALIGFAQENDIELTIVGPEVPLANGIVDQFQESGLRIFGPSQAAARIEASKAFAKDIMTEYGIPTGEYFTTDAYSEARKFLAEYQKPVVVKASGLAAGKGVLICDTSEQALDAVATIMNDRAFGDAGDIVIIEERLQGREISVLAFCDGTHVKPMIVARDYKRALDGNTGLNTGGMGAITPADDIPVELIAEVEERALQPILAAMNALETPYIGVLYAGLMLTDDGIKVLEYNCRFGDPETQVVLPMLKTDLYAIMNACIDGTLADLTLAWHEGYCATVVCAAGGYPETYPKGLPITGVKGVSEGIVFHAGTIIHDGQLVTNGGRVLAVAARGDTLGAALQTAYAGIEKIHFDDMHYRSDIGQIYE